MKTSFVICFCLSASLSHAQTAIIAHKSHSGAASGFSIDAFGNFGIPSRRMVQVVYLNDSTTLNIYTRYGNEFEADTVHSPIRYDLNIDSVKKNQPRLQNVEYVNFKHSPKSVKQKQPGFDTEKRNELAPQQLFEPQPEAAPKKKKRSYLLFLFGITGGGLIITGMLNRVFKPRAIS